MSTIEETVVVRAARPDDAPAIAHVFAYYVTETLTTFELVPPSPDDWRGRITTVGEAGLPFLVLARGKEVLGYAYASPWRPKPAYRHTVENSIYLAPGHTGRGYGRRLLAELLAKCENAGAHQVVAVIADTGLDASAALHRRAGFEVVGRLRRVGYKHGQWIDTVLMQRELAPAG